MSIYTCIVIKSYASLKMFEETKRESNEKNSCIFNVDNRYGAEEAGCTTSQCSCVTSPNIYG